LVSDESEVLRLVWHPSHFEGDKLKASAFDRKDVSAKLDDDGNPRYLSVDNSTHIVKASVDWRIAWQQRDGKDVKHHRHNAKFVAFLCAELRACEWESGKQMFDVSHEPMPAGADGPGSPENSAHCGVRTQNIDALSEKERRGYIEELRVRLLQARKAIFMYSEVFRT